MHQTLDLSDILYADSENTSESKCSAEDDMQLAAAYGYDEYGSNDALDSGNVDMNDLEEDTSCDGNTSHGSRDSICSEVSSNSNDDSSKDDSADTSDRSDNSTASGSDSSKDDSTYTSDTRDDL